MAARASRLENQDAIDAAIVSMLADPEEVLTCKHIVVLGNQLLVKLSHIRVKEIRKLMSRP